MRRQLQFLFILLPYFLPTPAFADWLTTPFAGFKFGGAICPCPLVAGDLVDPEEATGLRKFTFGASFALLRDQSLLKFVGANCPLETLKTFRLYPAAATSG